MEFDELDHLSYDEIDIEKEEQKRIEEDFNHQNKLVV
jgi:hypothetical protein